MRKKRMKRLGLLLSVTLILTQLPAVAMAENQTVGDGTGISSPVQEEFVEKQLVQSTTGDPEPDASNAPVATPGQADEITDDDIGKDIDKDYEKIQDKEYNEKAGELVKMITDWIFVDDENLTDGELALPVVSVDHQADFDTVVSMLPTQIKAEVETVDLAAGREGEPGQTAVEMLDITGWSCPDYEQDEEENWPVTGEYIFIAELPEDYICDPLPEVQVILGGASVMTINDRYTVNGLKYKEISPKTVQLIGLEDSSFAGTLTVPAEITAGGKTFAVTSIGTVAFRNSSITGLDLSGADYLTTIEDSAFGRCTGLTDTVKIPRSVTTIGEVAFAGSGITGLDLSEANNLIRIEDAAFRSCSALTGTVKIPRSVTEIGGAAFGSSGITELNLSEANNLMRIGESAFAYCSALTGILTIPASVTRIEEGAFGYSRVKGFIAANNDVAVILRNCGVEESKIKLPNGLSPAFPAKPGTREIVVDNLKYTITGTEAVMLNGYEGVALAGILTIPAAVQSGGITYRVTEIERDAFYGAQMTGIDFSRADNLVCIRWNAFKECYNLAGMLTIPVSVTEIGGEAFANTKITSVVIKGRIQVLGEGAFPDDIPIHCEDPATQLLVNAVFNRNQIPTASWNGKDTVPAGAIVTVDDEVRVTGDVAMEEGVETTIVSGGSVIIESGAVITIRNGGIMTISPDGVVDGNGTIIIEKGGKLIGTPGAGITVIDLNNPVIDEPVIDEPVIDEPVIDNNRTAGGGESAYINPNLLFGTWVKTDTGIWMFRQTNGGYAKSRWGIADGLWYYFNADGHMLTGWQLIGNQWYYLCTEEDAKAQSGRKEGAMVTGWQFDPLYQKWFYFDVNGAMITGWREIGGKWYYFNPESDGTRGSMYAGKTSPDGYELDEHGGWNG